MTANNPNVPAAFHYVKIAPDFMGNGFASQLMHGNRAIAMVYEVEGKGGKPVIRVVSEFFDLRFSRQGMGFNDEERINKFFHAEYLGKLITESMGYSLDSFI